MLSWRGCVQDPGSISKYRNQLKSGHKIRKNTQEQSDILCWHDIRGCVDGSGSISKYRTQPQKWLKHQTTMSKLPKCWRGCVQRSGSISKYRKCCYIMKGDYIIWLAFFLVERLVKSYDYFQKVSNFFSILCFSQ